jgi:hypothetical protein
VVAPAPQQVSSPVELALVRQAVAALSLETAQVALAQRALEQSVQAQLPVLTL